MDGLEPFDRNVVQLAVHCALPSFQRNLGDRLDFRREFLETSCRDFSPLSAYTAEVGGCRPREDTGGAARVNENAGGTVLVP